MGYSETERLMQTAAEAVEIRDLRRQGKSIRGIAPTPDVSRATVRPFATLVWSQVAYIEFVTDERLETPKD